MYITEKAVEVACTFQFIFLAVSVVRERRSVVDGPVGVNFNSSFTADRVALSTLIFLSLVCSVHLCHKQLL